MADLIYIAVIIAFFALAALFVVACDRIIGADESADTGTREPAPLDEVKSRMSYDNAVALVLAVLVAAYLVYALVFPEKL